MGLNSFSVVYLIEVSPRQENQCNSLAPYTVDEEVVDADFCGGGLFVSHTSREGEQ